MFKWNFERLLGHFVHPGSRRPTSICNNAHVSISEFLLKVRRVPRGCSRICDAVLLDPVCRFPLLPLRGASRDRAQQLEIDFARFRRHRPGSRSPLSRQGLHEFHRRKFRYRLHLSDVRSAPLAAQLETPAARRRGRPARFRNHRRRRFRIGPIAIPTSGYVGRQPRSSGRSNPPSRSVASADRREFAPSRSAAPS